MDKMRQRNSSKEGREIYCSLYSQRREPLREASQRLARSKEDFRITDAFRKIGADLVRRTIP